MKKVISILALVLLCTSCNGIKAKVSVKDAENTDSIEAAGSQEGRGTNVGDMFTDFAVTYNGKTTHLSDYVGKGKLCLVDFWASWCGPCRAEIPNVIEVFEKYGDKVNVLGVACWDKPQDTETAIQELGIKYPQMINAQEIGTDTYGIDGIPEIILFSPEGKILNRGLREAEIMKAVEKSL